MLLFDIVIYDKAIYNPLTLKIFGSLCLHPSHASKPAIDVVDISSIWTDFLA